MKNLMRPVRSRLKANPIALFAYRMFLRKFPIDKDEVNELWISSQLGCAPLSRLNRQLFSTIANHLLVGQRPVIIDVGANDGWFLRNCDRFFKPICAYVFEPLPAMRKTLENLAQSLDFEVFCRFSALGSKQDECIMHEYSTSGLSSLHSLSNDYLYNENLPSDLKSEYRVPVERLDQVLSGISKKTENPLLLKIDTQGHEMEVLKGATDLFERKLIDILVIESLTMTKYEKQPLIYETFEYVRKLDFILYDMYPSYREEETGQVSEYDLILVSRLWYENRFPKYAKLC